MDWAHVIKRLVDEDYADRERIVLVMDNLNTHRLPRSTRRLSPPRRGVSLRGWRYTTLPNMGVG